ncbi:Sodium/hydrogen exchanger 7, partial [Bienertia sinuspersici]
LSFPYDWNWTRSLLLGGILSTTDPVVVVAFLKEVGVSKKLSTIIEGESLINDECVLHAFYYILIYFLLSVWEWALFLERHQCCGLDLSLMTLIEITLTLAFSYIAYFT